MSTQGWKRYVTTMCGDAWDLDALTTDSVMDGIEALISDDRLTDLAVAEVLLRAGVSEFAADLAASSIRAAINYPLGPAEGTNHA